VQEWWNALQAAISGPFIYFVYCGLAGLAFALRRKTILTENLTERLTSLLIIGIYPALIFSTLTQTFNRSSLLASWDLPFALILLMSIGFIAGSILTRISPLKNWDAARRRSFIFMAAMPNFVFLPLLITQGLWGQEATAYLILASFGGDSFIWLVAIPILGGRVTLATIFRKPPIVAVLAAFVVIAVDRQDWLIALQPTNALLASVGTLTVPLSMIILGSHLGAQSFDRAALSSQSWLTLFRLGITPALTLAVLIMIDIEPLKADVLFLIATMPTAIASAILARLFRGDPRYCAQQILLSHSLAIITVPIWLYFAGSIFSKSLLNYSQTNQVCDKARGRRAAQLAPGQ
jgi:predicted permease